MNTIGHTQSSDRRIQQTAPVQATLRSPVELDTRPAPLEQHPAALGGDSDTVEVSGRAIMLSRLFRTDESQANTEIYRPGVAPRAGSTYNFLTISDRDVLASLYEHARDHDIDPRNVDALAFDLGYYRSVPSSSYVDNVGTTFDQNGKPLVFEFDPVDEAVAQRILTSKAISDTAIPEDFLRHILDPGFAPGDHAVDLNYLEQVVYATSSSGSDGATDPPAVLAPRPNERLSMMQSAGTVSSPSDVRHNVSSGFSRSKDLFAQVASRSEGALWSDANKELLHALLANTEQNNDPRSDPQMRTLDELTHTFVQRTGSLRNYL